MIIKCKKPPRCLHFSTPLFVNKVSRAPPRPSRGGKTLGGVHTFFFVLSASLSVRAALRVFLIPVSHRQWHFRFFPPREGLDPAYLYTKSRAERDESAVEVFRFSRQ